jgi:hypothetical protein
MLLMIHIPDYLCFPQWVLLAGYNDIDYWHVEVMIMLVNVKVEIMLLNFKIEIMLIKITCVKHGRWHERLPHGVQM